MKSYDLYLDSGPMMKKTFVQVPALMGCIGRGDTTAEAIERAPDAIRAYLRFMARHGERVEPKAPIQTRVAHHRTNSQWPGNGIGFLPTDEAPLMPREIDTLIKRLDALHADLRSLTANLSAKQLEATPAKGRPIRRILSHICVEGAYLRGISGASRMQREVDEGKLDPHEALDRMLVLETERLRAMSPAERAEVIMRGQSPWSARCAVRKMLEHCWEHYVEIAERLGKAP